MRFLAISYDQDEQLPYFDFVEAEDRAGAVEIAGELRPDFLPVSAFSAPELREYARQLTKAKASNLAHKAPDIYDESERKPAGNGLICPQCGAEDCEFYDGALGYEGIRCNVCWIETDRNNTDSFNVRTDKPEPERKLSPRIGCRQNVCTCHVDFKPAGFTCSACGCRVLRDEAKP